MEKTLICPGERRAVAFLAQTVPLVALPVLGESLLAYWMGWLANAGAKRVLVLATDRPELVRALLGDGSRWGLQIHVQLELQELSVPEVRARLSPGEPVPATAPLTDIFTADHLPGMEDPPLFRSYRDFFSAVVAWMPRAAKLNRIGLHEFRAQVWYGRRVQIAPSAVLQAPCWIGNHVHIGPDAVIGPNAILEDGVVVDPAAEVRESMVGPDTFVGGLTKLDNSIAWGNNLIDWRSGSCTQVPDPFLLCALGQRYLPEPSQTSRWNWLKSLWRLAKS